VTGQSYAKCNHHIAPSKERQQGIQVSYGIRFDWNDLAISDGRKCGKRHYSRGHALNACGNKSGLE
jgi:hypothetical protein